MLALMTAAYLVALPLPASRPVAAIHAAAQAGAQMSVGINLLPRGGAAVPTKRGSSAVTTPAQAASARPRTTIIREGVASIRLQYN